MRLSPYNPVRILLLPLKAIAYLATGTGHIVALAARTLKDGAVHVYYSLRGRVHKNPPKNRTTPKVPRPGQSSPAPGRSQPKQKRSAPKGSKHKSNTPPPPPQLPPIYTDISTSEVKDFEDRYQAFKASLKAAEAAKSVSDPATVTNPTPAERTVLEDIAQKCRGYCFAKDPKVKTVLAGSHHVAFPEEATKWVLKTPRSSAYTDTKAAAHCQAYQDAHRVIRDNNLYLLQIPKTFSIKGPKDRTQVIVQERLPLLGNADSMQGLYERAVSDPDCAPLLREHFRQLVTFITRTGFHDTNLGNIGITADGKIGLIDVDPLPKDADGTAKFYTGLVTNPTMSGLAPFSLFPKEWVEEEMLRLKTELPADRFSDLQKRIAFKRSTDYRQTRKQERDAATAFHAKQGTLSPKRQFNVASVSERLKGEAEEIQKVAVGILNLMNETFAKRNDLDLVEGRRFVLVPQNHYYKSNGWYAKANLVGARASRPTIHKEGEQRFQKAIEALKTAGYIHQVQHDKFYHRYTLHA